MSARVRFRVRFCVRIALPVALRKRKRTLSTIARPCLRLCVDCTLQTVDCDEQRNDEQIRTITITIVKHSE